MAAPHSAPLLRCLSRPGLHSGNCSCCSFSCPRQRSCWGICSADDACCRWVQSTAVVSEPRYSFTIDSHWAQSMPRQRHHCFARARGWKHFGAGLECLASGRGLACRIAGCCQCRRTRCDKASKTDSLPHAFHGGDSSSSPLIHFADYETARKLFGNLKGKFRSEGHFAERRECDVAGAAVIDVVAAVSFVDHPLRFVPLDSSRPSSQHHSACASIVGTRPGCDCHQKGSCRG